MFALQLQDEPILSCTLLQVRGIQGFLVPQRAGTATAGGNPAQISLATAISSPSVSAAGASLPPFVISQSPPIASSPVSPSISYATIAATPSSTSPPSSSTPCSPGSATAAAAAPSSTSGPHHSASTGPEAAKALKSQLETLHQVKSKLAGDPLCGHIADAIEQQMVGVRAQLASLQPLEVALRTTLVTVTQARAALQRAEAKAAKLEAAVVAAVATYEVAASEVQTCQRQLAAAEAATARTAGGRFDPRLLLGDHPGAALAILQEAAASRCVVGIDGVDSAFAARVQAAFAEVQEVCRRLPAAVPQAQSCQPANAAAPSPAAGGPAAEQSDLRMGEGVDGACINPPQGQAGAGLAAVGASGPSGQEAEAAAVAAAVSAQQLLQAQQEAALAAQAQEQHAAQLAAQQHQQALREQQCAAAAGPVQGQAEPPPRPNDENRTASEPAPNLPATGSDAAANSSALVAAVCLAAGDGRGNGDNTACDDAMGGGAADNVANKRSAAAASIETARSIAAKAKARAN